MKLDFFIDRPVFSTVLSTVIVIVGIVGLVLLPVDQYPQIVPPVVKVSASYPGANAQTVTQAVATPIEQELNGTPGMIYMESSSSNSGSFSATVTFDISTDPDLAAVDIQNRLKQAESRLPAEVVQNGISVEKQASSKLMTITLLSSDPKFDEIYLSNYATLNVLDMLRRIPGVGSVSNVGSRYYAMQIWVQPDKLANLGLTVSDLQAALKDQNRESAAGVLGQAPMEGVDITIPITAQGRLSSVSQFEEIVIRANPDGSIIRLRDVARISLEASSYNTESGINGGNAAVLNINMLPGANAMQVAESVRETMEEISLSFPEGISYNIPFDMTTYISESIHHVYRTLFEALLLVILVVYLSLQSWRATIIPIVAVPISLIGTFGVMMLFGFSLNMLTLLGLILAIGIVVDDAIVVVENVDRIMHEEHLPAREATKKAMKNLGGALIAMSLVLCAVFVPVSFLSGITGQLYRQFTITIAVSVVISTIVALTLSPVMCSLFLKPGSGRKNRFFRRINFGLATGNRFYGRMIRASLKHSRRMFTAFGIIMVGIWMMNRLVPSSFMPQEDQGYFTVELELPEGATIERTREVTDRAMAFLTAEPDVQYVLNVTGSSARVGTNQARSLLTVILKPWNERQSERIDEVMNRVRTELSRYPESKVYLSTPAVIPGLGSSGGFEMVLEARGSMTYEELQRAIDTLMHYAATVFRRGPRQGADAGRHSFRHFFHNESVHRFHLCQRLQYVQPHLPGLYSGRGALPRLSGQPEPFLRTRLERNDDSCHIARNDRLHHRTRHDQTLQHVQLGHRHGRGGPRVQFGSGHEGIGGSRPRTPSSVGRGGMERSLLSGETRRRENRFRTGAGFPVRFSVPCRTVRELVDSGSRPAFAAGSRYRGLHGHLAVRPRE